MLCQSIFPEARVKGLKDSHSSKTAAVFMLMPAIFSFLFAVSSAQAQDCTVSATTPFTTSSGVQLNVACPDAPFFKLSESPYFQETTDTGVAVSIDYIDPMGGFADVSIRYPNGSTGGNAIPFAVTETTRELRILAVLFKFGDGSLNPPSYATPTWVEKLVFSGDHDGRGMSNSIKAHIEQNTYGKVRVSGEVYPTWVDISSIEKYRDLNLTPTPDQHFAEEIVGRMVESDPGFFAGKQFDYLIALTPGSLRATGLRNYQLLTNWTDPYGIFSGCALFDIPIDNNSQIYDTIYEEKLIATSTNRVVTRYNPASVEGVWLSDDTARTGTNYYTGGSVRYDVTNPNYYAQFIELGTPLPTPYVEVIVSYYPAAGSRLTNEQMAYAATSTLPGTTSFGFMMHELYHGMGWLLTPNQRSIGDLYTVPRNLIESYGVMSTGAYNKLIEGENRFYVPANLSAYSKVNLNIVRPLTLQYGENEVGVRLYRSEEGDFTDTNSRTKAIKVPLHAELDAGYRILVGYPEVETEFRGEEYLLLEWRHAGELEGGRYNFDEALPQDGLLIYRVIEGDPERHGASQNIVRIIDATPVQFPFDSLAAYRSEEAFSMKYSAAPYGHVSDAYEYVADTSWNWKSAETTTADFQLSPGNGPKTVYAKFMDLNGTVIAQSYATVDVVAEQNQPPIAEAGDGLEIEDDGDGSEWVWLDGGDSYDPDGSLVEYQWYESGRLIAEGVITEVNLATGAHSITLVVHDDLGASATDDLQVNIVASTEVSAAPKADAGGDITVTDTDMDGAETVLLNASNSYDTDGSIVSYDWYYGNMLIASGVAPEVGFETGRYDIILTVSDDSGLFDSDSLIVEVASGGLDAPDALAATLSGPAITLSWADSSDHACGFYVERGNKVKNTIEYSRVATTNGEVTTYDDILLAGSYYFRVQSFCQSTVSDYSEALQVRIKK